jgi:hypothetical protein
MEEKKAVVVSGSGRPRDNSHFITVQVEGNTRSKNRKLTEDKIIERLVLLSL